MPATSDAMPQASAWMEKRCATAGSVVERSRVMRLMNGAVLAPADETKKVAAHSAISIVIMPRSDIAAVLGYAGMSGTEW